MASNAVLKWKLVTIKSLEQSNGQLAGYMLSTKLKQFLASFFSELIRQLFLMLILMVGLVKGGIRKSRYGRLKNKIHKLCLVKIEPKLFIITT